ncbi:MAG TPA: type I 3-dehydroquinate dehydratase [Chthoniobacterales bacterium]
MSRIDFRKVPPSVVAIIHTRAGFQEAIQLTPQSADFLEFRADLLLDNLTELEDQLTQTRLPIILTLRSRKEGGRAPEDVVQRAALYARLVDKVHAMDTELATVRDWKLKASPWHDSGCPLVLSYHDFTATPTVPSLREKASEAADLGASLFKIAALTESSRDVATLLEFLEIEDSLPLAVMGMGRYGMVSRLLFAQAGSRLNYGYLDRPIVPGQWPAAELKSLISRLP